jgi:uncharacterized protein
LNSNPGFTLQEQKMTEASHVSISALPAPLHWRGTPTQWALADIILTIRAGQQTDWFINPEGTANVLNAPALLMDIQHPCPLQAQVTVDSAATFDAGVLAVYQMDQVWAKICLELSPQGQLIIVSVVTKGTSDDCNSVPIVGNSIYLRIAKLEQGYAFHYSQDGLGWNLVRHFTLGGQREAEIGFLSQSPRGEGCTTSFGEITYVPKKLNDIRSGE